MKKHFLITLVLTITLFACRHKKDIVSSPDPKKPTADTLAKRDIYRFIISFYSVGMGPDAKAYRAFNTYVTYYQNQKNITIAMESWPWGREGEVDYCMRLSELTATEQRDFIANLKIALADAKWVHYYENAACRNKHH